MTAAACRTAFRVFPFLLLSWTSRGAELSGDRIRIDVSGSGADIRELIQIRAGARWVDAIDTRGAVVRTQNAPSCEATSAASEAGRIVVKGSCAEGSFERELRLGPDPDMASVSVRFTPNSGVRLFAVEDRLRFAPKPRSTDTPLEGPFDFVWSQNIKSAPEQIAAHWTFKSPAVMFQQGSVFAAIVPRLEVLTAASLKASPAALDLGVVPGDHGWLSYGVVSSRPVRHSYFQRLNDKPLQSGVQPIEYRYWIVASAEPGKLGYRRVSELLWGKFGGPGLRQSVDLQRNVRRPELLLFDDWRAEAWKRYANEKYYEFDCGDKRCGGLTSNREIALRNKEPKADAWFNAWFQNLRTAYGWFLYGRHTNNLEMKRKAEQVLNLALRSPRNNGAFSTIYLHDTGEWFRDDGWAGYQNHYHTFCMSWTAYWMLRWASDLAPERKSEILAFITPYADYLLRVQRPSGLIPSWLDENEQPREEFRDFNAETAGSALFLAEFSAVSGEKKYLAAALRAQEFIAREVLPRERWYDFETFRSCARKPFDFYDRWTTQYPQNNLSTMQAAQAYLKLYRLTRRADLLETGQQVVDYLLLTQQVWSHPLFTPKLLGGFTTQNTDAEWSDARQCYAAVLLLDYYRATGRLDYLERAVAAARSGFAVAPWENWAHTGHADEPGALTGIHWGTGSQMASVEMMAPFLGDAFVDVAHSHGVGFNACTLEHLRVAGTAISFDLKTVQAAQRVQVRFEGVDPRATYKVTVNSGKPVRVDGNRLASEGLMLN